VERKGEMVRMNVNTEPPRNKEEILRQVVAVLAERLPEGWRLQKTEQSSAGSQRANAFLEIAAPDQRTVTVVVEAKGIVEGRDVPRLVEQLAVYVAQFPNAQPLVAARYLSPQVRAQLVQADLGYADATGNVRLSVSSPGLFLSDKGSDSDPWRGPGRPRGTLKGVPAAKVVRTLVDFSGEWKVRDLVEAAGVSTGAGYRVVDFLEREGLAVRQEGTLSIPTWEKLLQRWSEDYGFVRNSRASRWIAPRGLEDLQKRASASEGITYAVTGTLAAAEWAAYAPARSAMIYTPDAAAAAAAWGLTPTEAGANVILAEPDMDVVFTRTLTNTTGLVIAAPTQVAVDLMTGPGRSPAEAEELLQWMGSNEQSWRI
jgi:hypothetical protein